MAPGLAEILARPAPEAAPRLLGWRLRVGDAVAAIAEVEAYHGEDDLACHASRGRTPRTLPLYARAGTLYVYLCYGIHHLLNLVCYREGFPSAVLIRGVAGLDPPANGPGKVCARLGLDRRHHGLHLDDPACPLAVQPPVDDARPLRRRGPRVGVGYAGPVWAAKTWRWWTAGFPAVGARG